MELFFRRYFWIANLFFLALTSLLVAQILSATTATMLAPSWEDWSSPGPAVTLPTTDGPEQLESQPDGPSFVGPSDAHFRISQEAARGLANMTELGTTDRIVPAFRDGAAIGFKVFAIRPGSLFDRMGLQNGDVLLRVNGYSIDSPDKALEVYGRLKESRRIEIRIERRGRELSKVLTFE